MALENWSKMETCINGSLICNKENGPVLTEKMSELIKIADDVVDILSDGFQFRDIISFFGVVGPVLDIARKIEGWDENRQDDFVVDAVCLIYRTVDTYPDGKQNNIKIPYLFGSLKTAFEKRLIDFVTRSVIRALRKYSK